MEKEEKIQIHIHEGVDVSKPIEVIIREGAAAKATEVLPTKAPESISLDGVISTPFDWLEKRVETIEQKQANIKVDREAMTIALTINETDSYNKNTITGKVQLSEVFEKFGINDERKAWAPGKLGQFLRLNRGVFEDKEKCMVMVSNLKNFTANAKSEIQKQRDPSGSMAEVYKCQVESNLPKSFSVCLAVFKGTPKERIEVEFDHYLSDGEVFLQLVSPGANEMVEAYRDSCIDQVLDKIKEIAPDIAILEV
ncbi:hypothetical protein M2451_002513 [Dysgonomonas sp. PFB1-18]|uniref:hypothetical protein n=1 Tax=unclassified Dysgonomonas TaxID=2630389 RepID=UPI0024746006|nr:MULTISPECIES: hypothetical protein [unclassified Dysgonomonas]MDH6307994.1 hypothetical protein [Dysgonomonas sp. PF1-14]MDH6339533.1 hypothetical protein [Dysgonomonas sp. PF1-16]MDH6381184.1 hypothetical protein [Dysgonomonas sp. PFB1-18]MDH6398396.1 hypothetical protein [Dysgonomonas sp. PF1-23]